MDQISSINAVTKVFIYYSYSMLNLFSVLGDGDTNETIEYWRK